MTLAKRTALWGLLILVCTLTWGQPLPLPLSLTAVAKDAPTLRIDGVLDDAAWLAAKPFTQFRQFRPETRFFRTRMR
jgi:hypothetical protein